MTSHKAVNSGQTEREAWDVALDALDDYQRNWDTGLPAEYASGERIAMECAVEAVREALNEARAASTVTATDGGKALSNLLAVIHRDGGHYEQQHGTEKAARDAEAVVVAMRALSEQSPAPASPSGEDAAEEAAAPMVKAETFVMCLDDVVEMWNSVTADSFEDELMEFAAKAINFYKDSLPGSATLPRASEQYAEQGAEQTMMPVYAVPQPALQVAQTPALTDEQIHERVLLACHSDPVSFTGQYVLTLDEIRALLTVAQPASSLAEGGERE